MAVTYDRLAFFPTSGPRHVNHNDDRRCLHENRLDSGRMPTQRLWAVATPPPRATATGKGLTWVTSVHTVPEAVIVWDPPKAEANLRQHGVSFAEAATVLTDDFALTREDPDAIGEQRFVSLGMSATGALLVVVYTHREPDAWRLISSWKANKLQRKQYEEGRR